MMKKFPLMIHVTIEDLSLNEEPYLQVQEGGVFTAAEVGKSRKIAIYKLVEIGSVVAPPSYVAPKRKRR